MKRILIIATAICALCPVGFNLSAQENTTYFYRTIIHAPQKDSTQTPCAYLPVYMSRAEEPDKIIATSMTDIAGVASFYGTPIDIYKDYIFTLPVNDGNLRYISHGFKEQPRWKNGNTDNLILIDEGKEWETSVVKFPEDNAGSYNALEWVVKEFPNIVRKGSAFYDKETNAQVWFLINGNSIPQNPGSAKLISALKLLPADYIESVKFVTLTNPNEYFTGAIDITLPEIERPKEHGKFNSYLQKYEE